jgi:hypothetical protein
MHLSKIQGGVAAICLAVSATGADITYRVTGNPGACHDVRVGKWSPGYRRASTNGCRYEFRSPGNDVLYIGVYCLETTGKWDSLVKYEIDLARPKQVLPVVQPAWGSAATLKGELWKQASAPVSSEGIEYAGHMLRKSGPQWHNYATFISPGEKRIALNSLEGGVGYPGPFEPGPIRAKGKYWIDIYDVQTGQRELIIQGTFHGGADADPGLFQGRAFWLTDRYYVLPLEPHGMRRLLICDVDAAMSQDGSAP